MSEGTPMHQMTPTKSFHNREGLPFNMNTHMLENPFTSPTMDISISMSPTAPRADEKYTEGKFELPQAKTLFKDITNKPAAINPSSESRETIIKRDAKLEESKKADIRRDKLSKKILRKLKSTFPRGGKRKTTRLRKIRCSRKIRCLRKIKKSRKQRKSRKVNKRKTNKNRY